MKSQKLTIVERKSFFNKYEVAFGDSNLGDFVYFVEVIKAGIFLKIIFRHVVIGLCKQNIFA